MASTPLFDSVEDATAAPAAAGSHGDWVMLLGSTFSGLGSINEEEVESLGAIGNVRGAGSREDAI